MAPTQEQILDVCQVLAEQEELNVTIKAAGKGFLYAGIGAAGGTLLGGPLGMFIGGTAGSAIAAYHCRGQCRSVVEIIKNMSAADQSRLAQSVARALQNFSAEDLLVLLPLVLSSDPLKSVAVKEIIRFMTNEMGMIMANQT